MRHLRTTEHSGDFARRPTSRTARGFTLLEMLVATAITAAMIAIIVAIVGNVSAFWSRTAGRLTAEAQGRYVLDQLTLDLSSALFRDDGNVWMAANVVNTANGTAGSPWQLAALNAKPVTPATSQGSSLDMSAIRSDLPLTGRTTYVVIDPITGTKTTLVWGPLTSARFGNAGTWLRFFTTRRGANTTLAGNASATAIATNAVTTASAPVAVSYEIVRRFTTVSTVAPAGTRTGYLLHRVEARPSGLVSGATTRPGVLESGYTITGAAYTTSTASTNNGSTTGDPRTIQVVTTTARNFDSVIAQNVIDFGIRAYVRDANGPGGLRLVFPAADQFGSYSNAGTARLISSLPATTTATAQNFNQVFPDVVDVMVRILTDEGARLIALYEANPSTPASTALPTGRTAQQYWWDIADANSQVFTRRIVLNAKPL